MKGMALAWDCKTMGETEGLLVDGLGQWGLWDLVLCDRSGVPGICVTGGMLRCCKSGGFKLVKDWAAGHGRGWEDLMGGGDTRDCAGWLVVSGTGWGWRELDCVLGVSVGSCWAWKAGVCASWMDESEVVVAGEFNVVVLAVVEWTWDLLFSLLRQYLSTIGAVSLQVGKSPGLMFIFAWVEMREDSTSCLLVLWLDLYSS